MSSLVDLMSLAELGVEETFPFSELRGHFLLFRQRSEIVLQLLFKCGISLCFIFTYRKQCKLERHSKGADLCQGQLLTLL